MTKEEAAKKACPFSFGQRFVVASKLDSRKGQEVSMNCCGENCMAWRELIGTDGERTDCVLLRP